MARSSPLLKILVLVLGLLPASLANAQWFSFARTGTYKVLDTPGANEVTVKGLGTFVTSKLHNSGVTRITRSQNRQGEVTYNFVDGAGKIVQSFIIGKTSPQVLEKFSPSKLNQYFTHLTRNAGGITSHKLRDFPMESFTFFVAIGAVNTADLIFNYSKNPIAMEQHFLAQKDPVAHAGFAAFMVANGLTSEPLMAVAKSKMARHFIPYLGMSAGMMASNIVHEVGHFPGLLKCARDLVRQNVSALTAAEKLKVCDEAYEAWTKMSLSDKGHEWAPGLFAMAASTAMAGLGEAGIKGTGLMIARVTPGAAVRLIGLELMMLASPGGPVMQFARWTYKVSQFAGFLYLDNLLREPFSFTWQNYMNIGPKLVASDQAIGRLINSKLSNNWQPETRLNRAGQGVCSETVTSNCYRDLAQELGEFHVLMGKWREMNLAPVLTAHQSWSQYLSMFSSQYRVSKQFYGDFVSNLWKRKYQLPANYISILDRSMPLYGVKAKDLTSDEYNHYLEKPDQIVRKQRETIQDVVATIDAKASETALVVTKLKDEEKHAYSKIVDGLRQTDLKKLGEALELLRYLLGKDPVQKFAIISPELKSLLEPIFTELGNPQPLWAPGHGYLWLVANNPNNNTYKNNPFPTMTGVSTTPTAPEYLIQQMVYGPNAERGEKSVRTEILGVSTAAQVSGFKAQFAAPRLRESGRDQMMRVDTRRATVAHEVANSSFAFKFSFELNGQMSTPGSILDFLKTDGAIPAHILGNESGSKITEWWDQFVEPEVSEAYVDYETKYEAIIQQFYQRLFLEEQIQRDGAWDRFFRLTGEWTNKSPIANGVMKSIEQEREVYLYVLSAILNPTTNPIPRPTGDRHYSVLSVATEHFDTAENWAAKMRTKWQELDMLFKKLEQKPVVTEKGPKLMVVSRLTNEELQKFNKELEELTAAFPVSGREFNPLQKAVIAVALTGLKKTGEDILNYGQIINNVSYVENFGDGVRQPVPRRCVEAPAMVGTQQWRQARAQMGCPN